MSVSLNCPNCGAVIGTASNEDNYKEKYYYKDNEGNPICKYCGSGKSGNIEKNIFIFVMAVIAILIILAFCLNL